MDIVRYDVLLSPTYFLDKHFAALRIHIAESKLSTYAYLGEAYHGAHVETL